MHCLIFNFNKQLANNARSLGCYRMAHFLREHGWDVEVIEYAAYWDLTRLQQLARSRITEKTQWVGVGHVFSDWNDTMEQFFLDLKRRHPNIAVISGSAVNPAFQSQAIDYYVQGYGEYATLELLKYLFSNGSAPRFNLLASGAKKIIPAIAAYPAYPMPSLMVKYQPRDFVLPGEWLGIEFARGCKFSCAHCNFPVLGVRGDHTRDAEDCREQLMDAYDRWGVSGYYVADETFNDRTEKITKFADVVETLPFEPWFSGYVRADLMISRAQDREELARMGFRGQFYGIESFTHSAAKTVGKGMESDRLKQGLLDIKKYFQTTGNGRYRGEISLIVGLPTETISQFQDTMSWLKQHWGGQYCQAHVLGLLMNQDDKPNRLALECQKHGYREMTAEEISQAEHRVPNPHFRRIENRLVGSLTKWKNHDMDIYQAAELEQQVYDEWSDITKPNGHGIDVFRYASVLLHDHDLDSRLSVDSFTMNNLIQTKQTEIIENYINQKLSI